MARVQPFFSVIIPCYRQAQYLADAVGSVAAQGVNDLEVIIINDGSPDDASAVTRTLIQQYPNLHILLVEQSNQGLAMARNAGIAATQGQWITALDSDDLLAEGFLQSVAEAASRHPDINAVTGAHREFGALDGEWKMGRYDAERMKQRCNILCTTTYRRSLWEACKGYDPSHPWGYEDWHFWLKCQEFGFSLLSLPVPMLHYRIHASGSMYSALQEHHKEAEGMFHCMLPQIYPESVILQAHEKLTHMGAETIAALERKLDRLPRLPLPHFWLGLACEGRGDKNAARARYEEALQYSWPGAWQALLRLDGLQTK